MTELNPNPDNIISSSSIQTRNQENAIVPYDAVNQLPENTNQGSSNLIGKLISKWPVILITCILISSIAVPGIMLFTKSSYEAQILIEVLPVTPTVLTDPDGSAKTVAYDTYKNTQCRKMLSENILQDAAYELSGMSLDTFIPPAKSFEERLKQAWRYKNLNYVFNNDTDIFNKLKSMVKSGDISAVSDRRSNYIIFSVSAVKQSDAKIIADQIRNSYIEMVVSTIDSVDNKISTLRKEMETLEGEIDRKEGIILNETLQYGRDLSRRHDMLIKRIEGFDEKIIAAKEEMNALDTRVKELQNTAIDSTSLSPDFENNLKESQSSYINQDERIKRLNESIIKAEEELLTAEQYLNLDNPELEKKKQLIQKLQEKVTEREAELTEQYAGIIAAEKNAAIEELKKSNEEKLKQATEIYNKQVAYIEQLESSRDAADEEAKKIGRLDVEIQKKESDLAQIKGLYNQINDTINKLNIESERPERIIAGGPVAVFDKGNKKFKLLGGAVLGSLAAGLALAFLLVKTDSSLHSPDDIINQAGLAIVGTTIDTKSVKKKDLTQFMSMDFQNIRANLKLMNGGEIPQKILIASPEPREGKTSLAINLASSLARSGHRVLLIDGDLRKPDLHRIMNLHGITIGLREVASGICIFEDAVFEEYHPNLDVLRACGSTNFDTVQLLSGRGISEFIERMQGRYDNIIIDSTPVLAAPDALLWARLADAVVLSSLSGRTTGPALKTTIERLSKLNVKILGNVLASVKSGSSYGHDYHYYDYNYGNDKKAKKNKDIKYHNLIIDTDSQA